MTCSWEVCDNDDYNDNDDDNDDDDGVCLKFSECSIFSIIEPSYLEVGFEDVG